MRQRICRMCQLNTLKRNESGFSGIEAAIVLIAFVVIATVFTYVMLSAGFFTTQKSQQIAHAGVTQTASEIVVRGDVIGLDTYNGGNVSVLEFDLGLAQGGLPVDVSKMSMKYSTSSRTPIVLVYRESGGSAAPPAYGMVPGSWTIVSSNTQTGTAVLHEGERATIRVMPPVPLNPGEDFNLQITTENGVTLGIDRTVPNGVTNTTILY